VGLWVLKKTNLCGSVTLPDTIINHDLVALTPLALPDPEPPFDLAALIQEVTDLQR